MRKTTNLLLTRLGPVILLSLLAAACVPPEGSGNVERRDGGSAGRSERVRDQETEGHRDGENARANADVVGVSDGDTLKVRMRDTGKQERVRLATIDAPESRQAFGQVSKKSLSDLAFGKPVRLEGNTRDQYGRIIAEVFVGELNLNVEQIRRGLAWHYKQYQRQQTVSQRRVYAEAERTARAKRVGLWNDGKAVPPWEYRRSTGR